MRRARDLWNGFGRVPSLVAFVVFYGLAFPIGLLLDDPVGGTLGFVLFVLFIVYCVARPDNRLDVFLYAAAPGATGSLLHDLFGISRLWGLAAVPITIGALRDIDRGDETMDPASAAPEAS
jgi:hypothetical protein